MPRVSVCENFEDFDAGRSDDPMNCNIDYCRSCHSDICLEEIATEYGVPDAAVEMECDHPCYEDWDYSCEQCGCTLTDKDN